MSGSSNPSSRCIGRALVVGTAAYRASTLKLLGQLGYESVGMDEPYSAMAELCQRPLAYRTLVLSLASLFREELGIIASVRRRFTHVEVWLADTDGRAAALAEACRLGSDGLLSEEGLHRFATAVRAPDSPGPAAAEAAAECAPAEAASEAASAAEPEEPSAVPEPVLTAEELRALLDGPEDSRQRDSQVREA